MRVVLDTNIIVSAALDTQAHLVPHGRPSLCVVLALSGVVTLVASPELLAEYAAVLARPRFKLPPQLVRDYLASIRARTTIAAPAPIPVGLVTDPNDTHVLACAIGGRADFLVTGNVRDFPAHYRRTRIVRPAEFVAALLTGVE